MKKKNILNAGSAVCTRGSCPEDRRAPVACGVPRAPEVTAASACRPDGVGSVLHEEKDKFQEIKEQLDMLLENQIANFR